MSAAIAEAQRESERKIQPKYDASTSDQQDQESTARREKEAATSIQRTYRGYRVRRELQGLSLDPASRWTEAVKEARYQHMIKRAASSHPNEGPTSPTSPKTPPRRSSTARSNWNFAGSVARRANADEESSLSDSTSSGSLPDHDQLSPSHKQKVAKKQRKLAEKQERAKSAKTMGLPYFLEMVDVKHRYGSNLRKYHAEWASRPTKENFFRWLDHGDGKHLDLPNCSRKRLDDMQVRYLGREERRLYEVIVAKHGSLVWRKDGQKVDTSDAWRDSVNGIVKVDDPTPLWANRPAFARGSSESSSLGSEIDLEGSQALSGTSAQPSQAKDKPSDDKPKRHQSIRDVLTSPIGKRREKKPKQNWIFVSDTKNNLYVGIKQTGAFQHSSFLHGSRVSVAGLIHVKDGQLRLLEPRSGHYQPKSHNLRIFIQSLQNRGVDMSITAVGGSYAAMVGIEGYMKTKGRLKGLKHDFKDFSLKKRNTNEDGKEEEQHKAVGGAKPSEEAKVK